MRLTMQPWPVFLYSLGLLSGSLLLVTGIDPDCNYYEDGVEGPNYHVFLPNYTKPYNCQWIVKAPTTSLVNLNCNFRPSFDGMCQHAVLKISLTGNASDYDTYCRVHELKLKSYNNEVKLQVVSPQRLYSAEFHCTLNISEKPFVQDQRFANDCGWWNEARIVGGEETGVNEYPMMAGLINIMLKDLFCGATIISARYVITTAQCAIKYPEDEVYILTGDHNISTDADTASTHLYGVNIITVHPEYDPLSPKQMNDIAIVQTEYDIVFSSKVGPVCLPFQYNQFGFLGAKVSLLGWGTTEFAGPKSNVLRETEVLVVNADKCDRSTQLCTYYDGRGACQGDTGGPVLWSNNSRQYLVGITSNGFRCGTGEPEINTRVTAFLRWILSLTPEVHYAVI